MTVVFVNLRWLANVGLTERHYPPGGIGAGIGVEIMIGGSVGVGAIGVGAIGVGVVGLALPVSSILSEYAKLDFSSVEKLPLNPPICENLSTAT